MLGAGHFGGAQRSRAARVAALACALLTTLAASCRPTAAPSSEIGSPAPTPAAVARPPASAPLRSNTQVAQAAKAAQVAAPEKPPPRTNVLLISIDSLRADMPWAGYPRDIAPRLTALEKRCTSYSRAYATASHTAPSVGSMLYGRYPSELPRDGYFSTRYPASLRSFAAVLTDAGVRTLAGHAHLYLKHSGFGQGFSKYELLPGLLPSPNVDTMLTGKALEALAERQLGEVGDRAGDGEPPFFAWYHFLDPHADWLEAPRAEGIPRFGPKPRDRYDGEVFYTDKYVGKLLDYVETRPWGANTMVIVTSDHGEAIGDHGQLYHGYEVWESLVHVPLLVCAPGAAPQRIDTPRSLIDLSATVLEAFDVPLPPDFRGVSWLPEVRGGPAEARDVLIDLPANNLSFSRRALVGERTKIVAIGESRRRVVYDLEADPRELAPIRSGPLFDEQSSKLTEFERTLKEVRPTACARGCIQGWP